MLIFKLRESYPGVYAKIGSPSTLSRNTEFLWGLKSYECDLAPDVRRLRGITQRFFLLFAAFMLAFVGIVITSAFRGKL